MSCFLLRDGRTLSLELMVEANKVFTYIDQQGRCVHALLSAAAERELLARVPVAQLPLQRRLALATKAA